ncbi:Optineurin, partial [Stegodyphus mimosarum]
MWEKNSSEEMTSFEVLPNQNGLSESFDSAEFSFIPASNPEENFDLTNMQSALTSSTADLSVEIQARLVELLEENAALKEALKKNNIIMQEQMSTVTAWHSQVTASMSLHQSSLHESRKRIQQLEKENAELQLKVKELERKSHASSPDNASFTVINSTNEETGDSANESKPMSGSSSDNEECKRCCEVLKKQIEECQKALEETKSSDGKIIQRLQREVITLQDALKSAQSSSSETSQCLSSVQAEYEGLKAEYDKVMKLLGEYTEDKKDKRSNEKCEDTTYQMKPESGQEQEEAWKLKFDIYQNKLDMANSLIEKYKERYETLQQQIDEYQVKLEQVQTSNGHVNQKLQEELQAVREKLKAEQYYREQERCKYVEVKTQFERIRSDYDRVTKLAESYSRQEQLKSENFVTMREAENKRHLEEMDNLTAQLFDTQQKLEEQKEKVKELTSELNTIKKDGEIIPILKSQVEVFKSDLNHAVLAKEIAQEEAEKLSQELNNLYSSLSLCSNCDASRAISDLRSHSRLKAKAGGKKGNSNAEQSRIILCPVCSFGFTDLKAAENHVNSCIDKA